MEYNELREQLEGLQPQLTPTSVEKAIRALLRQGEDVGGGINATRLVRHLLGNPRLNDPQTVWAYDRLKPDLVAYECEAEGFKKVYLDKTEEFTHVVLRPRITVRNDGGTKVHRALKMARKYSLIAASLKSAVIVEPEIAIEPSAAV